MWRTAGAVALPLGALHSPAEQEAAVTVANWVTVTDVLLVCANELLNAVVEWLGLCEKSACVRVICM